MPTETAAEVSPANDAQPEPDETIRITLSSPAGAGLDGPGTFEVTITNDDTAAPASGGGGGGAAGFIFLLLLLLPLLQSKSCRTSEPEPARRPGLPCDAAPIHRR